MIQLDRSLMVCWRKKILRPDRVSSVFTFLSVCLRATGHIFWARNLIFWFRSPWDIKKKRNFLFFQILKIDVFWGIFRFFLLYLCICHRPHHWTYQSNFWYLGSFWHRKWGKFLTLKAIKRLILNPNHSLSAYQYNPDTIPWKKASSNSRYPVKKGLKK